MNLDTVLSDFLRWLCISLLAVLMYFNSKLVDLDKHQSLLKQELAQIAAQIQLVQEHHDTERHNYRGCRSDELEELGASLRSLHDKLDGAQ